jgi:hypothetical protein
MSKTADYLWLAAGMAVITVAGAAEPASAKDGSPSKRGTMEITLRVYDYAHMGRTQLLDAECVTAAILSQAGLEVRWVDCPTSQAEWDNFPDCHSGWEANDFVLKVLPKRMADLLTKGKDALGSAPECSIGAICFASIFLYRINSAFEGGGTASVPILLGRAMAHEIGHLLLGENSHAEKGVMRADWSDQDLTLAARPYLLFTPEQSRRMKSRLAARAQAWQTQARAANSGRH